MLKFLINLVSFLSEVLAKYAKQTTVEANKAYEQAFLLSKKGTALETEAKRADALARNIAGLLK